MNIRKCTWIIGSIIIVMAGALLYGYKQYQRTNQDLREVQADEVVEATTLIHEFTSNDKIADTKYRKRILAVRGIVKMIDTTNNGVSVILGEASLASSIRISMDTPCNEISTIHKGMPVTIKGILNGYSEDASGLLGNEVVFNRGVLIPHQ